MFQIKMFVKLSQLKGFRFFILTLGVIKAIVYLIIAFNKSIIIIIKRFCSRRFCFFFFCFSIHFIAFLLKTFLLFKILHVLLCSKSNTHNASAKLYSARFGWMKWCRRTYSDQTSLINILLIGKYYLFYEKKKTLQ